MGSSKRATVGYWYRLNLMFGLCRGPIDAFLEFRGGDRTAWAGELTQSGTISINQPDLWGGEKSEGGIVGDCDVMFGTADQEKNAWALAAFGADQGAYRGRAVLFFKGGKYGAMNPYPKPASFKVRRIKKGWDNDQCWYPEKAELVTPDYAAQNAFGVSWRMVGTTPYTILNVYYTDGVASKIANFSPRDGKRHTITVRVRGSVELRTYPGGEAVSGHVTKGGIPGDVASFNVYKLEISSPPATYYLNTGVSAQLAVFAETFTVEADDGAVITLSADTVDGRMIGKEQTLDIDVPAVVSGGIFMNPAHILYDSITSRDMLGEPSALVNDASFKAAADKLYAESFGLCTTFDATAESIEEFQQRICNCIGGALSRDRQTGLWSLDLLRGDYVLAALPVLTDDDILDFTEEPSVLDDAVNQVVVEWFDPIIKEARSTVPVQSLGAIAAFGGVIAETLPFPEIPDETLALRVAARELRSRATPLRRLELKTNRVPYHWRPGTYFRLQAPRRGIADMVCLVGEIDVGTLRQGAISLTAVQDVFGMPNSVYVAAQQSPSVSDGSPAIPEHQRLFEVPYTEVVQMLSAADLDYLDPDVGYVAAVAGAPGAGLNYTLMTGAEGESLQNRGSGDWTPVIVVSGADGYGYLDSDITFDESSGPNLVSAPCAALWDDEIVRIDALDAAAGTATIARGCADTVPQPHLAGSVIYVFDVEASTDGRKYADGETVNAKLLTRVGGTRLSVAQATALECEVWGRWSRPYPPGNVLINGSPYPSSISGPLSLSWNTRNRIAQGDALLDTTESSVTPEAGQTTTVRVYHGVSGALLREWVELSETILAYSAEQESSDGGGIATEDALWESVALCLTFDGVNESTTITDLSPSPKAVTANGNARITTSRYQYNKSSLTLDGSGDYLSVPASPAWDFGTEDFCFEAGVFIAANSAADGGGYRGAGLLFLDAGSGLAKLEWTIRGSTTTTGIGMQIGLDPGTGYKFLQSTNDIPQGEFVRLKCSRTSGVVSFYANDVYVGGGYFPYAVGGSTYPLKIGGRPWVSNYTFWLNGNISYIRITPAARETADLPSYQPPGRFVFVSGLSPKLRIELESTRNGLVSLQKHNVTVTRPAP